MTLKDVLAAFSDRTRAQPGATLKVLAVAYGLKVILETATPEERVQFAKAILEGTSYQVVAR